MQASSIRASKVCDGPTPAGANNIHIILYRHCTELSNSHMKSVFFNTTTNRIGRLTNET